MEGFARYADLFHRAAQPKVGVWVLYRPQGRTPTPLKVLWSDPHEEMLDTGEGVAVSTTDPVAHVRWADLKPGVELRRRDLLEKGGTTYQVSEVKPSGDVGARLILREPDCD